MIDAERSAPGQMWHSIDTLMGRRHAPMYVAITADEMHRFFNSSAVDTVDHKKLLHRFGAVVDLGFWSGGADLQVDFPSPPFPSLLSLTYPPSPLPPSPRPGSGGPGV